LVANPSYRINCPLVQSEGLFIQTPRYISDIKEEHAIDGFYKVQGESSLFTIYDGDMVFSFEDPKKASARNSRLVFTPESISIGRHKVFVLDTVPVELSNWFVTGAGFCPDSLLERLGAMRITSKEGCKFVTSPCPKDSDKGIIFLCKNSFKGGLNGVVMNKLGLVSNPSRMMTISDEDKEDIIQDIECRKFNGISVSGYLMDCELYVSQFYALHGLQQSADQDCPIDENGSIDESSQSFYVDALLNIKKDNSFDLIGHIMDSISKGLVKYGKDTIDLKVQEFSVARWSYGNVGTQWMEKVLSSKSIRGSVREGLDLMTGKSLPVNLDRQDFWNATINGVFKGVRISESVMDPEEFAKEGISLEDYKERLDVLLNGNGTTWDGLLGQAKNIVINGYDFYIPSGFTMKEYINFEEGSNRVMFSGPAHCVLKLILSLKHKSTNWAIKEINHLVELQDLMLGKNIDRFNVDGGHYTIIPAPWLSQSQVALISQDEKYGRGWKINNGARATFSKMPVLFNKAIADMHVSSGIPQSMFRVSQRMRLAMRNMVFTNVKVLLDHQNDTDGDMGRISLTGGTLPVYDGLPDHMHKWAHEYSSDEYKMDLKYKEYKQYSLSDMDDAVNESVASKKYVGTGTNSLTYVSHVLELYKDRGYVSADSAVKIRDSYSMLFQDEKVRGIKHESKSDMFEHIHSSKLFLFDSKTGFNFDAPSMLIGVVKSYTNESLSMEISTMFQHWYSTNGNIGLSARRIGDIQQVSLIQSGDESSIKLLDSTTRAFLAGVVKSQPLFAYANSYGAIDRNNAFVNIMNNVDSYKDKYILIGKNYSNFNDGTTVSALYSSWGNKSDVLNDIVY
jgi:hypothetical protein